MREGAVYILSSEASTRPASDVTPRCIHLDPFARQRRGSFTLTYPSSSAGLPSALRPRPLAAALAPLFPDCLLLRRRLPPAPAPPLVRRHVSKLANYATPPVSPPAYRALEPPFNVQLKGRAGGMDNDRRPRQSPAGYASQQGTLLQPQASYPVVSAPDRFRQAPLPVPVPLTTQPPTNASASRSSAQSYGYAYEGASQFVASSLHQPYAAQDYADSQQTPQRASQQYPQYPQGVLYGVSGQPSQAGSSQYEAVPQYQQNRDSAIEVLGTNFGVAQPQYYAGVPSEGGPTSAPASAIAPQSLPSQFPPVGYTPQQAAAPAYSTAAMTDPQPPTSHGGYSQPGYAQAQPQQEGSGNEYDDFYNTYQTELKKTFEQIRDGRLGEAAPALDRLSDWLLHWAETLGLVRDDEAHYQMRLKLWEEFNNCWLALFQKQYEMAEAMQTSKQRPQAPQSLVDYDVIEKMGTKLVKNCDNMEKHGLVDYQMGVWEEEITAMLMKCLEQLESMGAGSSAPRASASGSRRR